MATPTQNSGDGTRKFQRKVEDFKCEHCGEEVKGNGFTNHCPKCLWSKHVDVNPGDRASECGGLMKPIGAEYKSDQFTITYECESCGEVKRCVAARDDNRDLLIELTAQPVPVKKRRKG
jgi:predicted RNA-binding Zn-ribbon protein involved in translation (DUF1610 family)